MKVGDWVYRNPNTGRNPDDDRLDTVRGIVTEVIPGRFRFQENKISVDWEDGYEDNMAWPESYLKLV